MRRGLLGRLSIGRFAAGSRFASAGLCFGAVATGWLARRVEQQLGESRSFSLSIFEPGVDSSMDSKQGS